ncbi:hypothetical protein [Streptomyces cyaneofuscatus]|uniref:hypothetical protein n=1 Tax=Streptomyces cyaneofuscatus TaxID=66883 RepID=UPI00366791D1
MGSVRAGRLFATVGLALVMGAGGAACGSGDSAAEEPFVGAAEVCDGLFAGPLAKEVESVTGDTVFHRSGPGKMGRVADALRRGHESGRSWATGAELCRLSPKGGGSRDRGELRFSMYAPQDVGDLRLPEGWQLYTLGKQSEVGPGGASLYFECVSPQMKGSEETPLRIRGGFGRGRNDAPDTRELRDANLEILHAASLAVAKELDCEDNAGLPEKPDLRPRP